MWRQVSSWKVASVVVLIALVAVGDGQAQQAGAPEGEATTEKPKKKTKKKKRGKDSSNAKAATFPSQLLQATSICRVGRHCFLLGRDLPLGGGDQELRATKKDLERVIPTVRWTSQLVAAVMPEGMSGTWTLAVFDGGVQISNELSVVVHPETAAKDADGDGVDGVQGADCDDSDNRRFPGNPELTDDLGHDEDCNPASVTSGYRVPGHDMPLDSDRDGDLQEPVTACNLAFWDGTSNRYWASPSTQDEALTPIWLCGTDCDDSNPAIHTGSQTCVPGEDTAVYVCTVPKQIITGNGDDPRRIGQYLGIPGQTASPWVKFQCPTGSTCVSQPNGTGVCK